MGIYIENVWKPQWAWATAFTNTEQLTPFGGEGSESLVRASGFTQAENIGFNIDNTTGIFKTDFSGLYYLNVSASFSDASNEIFSLQFSVDGVALEQGKVKWTQKGGNWWEVSMALIYQLNGLQQVDVLITNLGGETSISLKSFTQTMIKLF